MIQSLHIERFRCYESEVLHDLRRVNVIVGSSATGKTAILESLFLTASVNAEVLMRLRVFRGMGRGFQIQDTASSFESTWADLFFNRDTSKKIAFQAVGSDEDSTRGLEIRFGTESALDVSPESDVTSASIPLRPIVMNWTRPNGDSASAEIRFEGTEIKVTIAKQRGILTSFLNSVSLFDSPKEAADRFSQLSLEGRDSEILGPLQQVFPDITGLQVLTIGGVSNVCASVKGLSFKEPIGLYSAGATKLIGVLLAIAMNPRGMVLIDEIENGLHFTALRKIWKLILEFSRKFECQVFVTTHSVECLRELLPVIQGNEAEFGVIRTKTVSGRTSVIQSNGQTLEAAIIEDFELRA